jgi:hypothetical protein
MPIRMCKSVASMRYADRLQADRTASPSLKGS